MNCARDAHLLRKLVIGHDPGDEIELISESLWALADQLARLPLQDRPKALEDALGGNADMIRAIAEADPSGPIPDVEEWPPMRLGELPEAHPFPVDVFPQPAADLVVQGSRAIGCQPDFLGVFALAVAAGAIGRSVSLLMKAGYFVAATLYVACIGPASDGKTPALKAVALALRKIDEALEAEYAQDLERWQVEADRVAEAGKKQKPPPRPKPRRIDVDDITMETIPVLLAHSPRGLVMVRDELTALFQGLNQYKSGGKGNDRAILLKIWGGDAIKKDRVGNEDNVPIRCAHPSLSILGGLTPGMLGVLLDPKGRADGSIDRFLLAYPEVLPIPPWSERGIPDDVAEGWHKLIAQMFARPMNEKDGQEVPHVAMFDPEGRARWEELYDVHVREMNRDDFPPHLRGPWGKFREYAGRLALVLACMRHAADPCEDELSPPTVGVQDAENAWRLIGYFKNQALRVHATIGEGPKGGVGHVVRSVVDWIRGGQKASFSEHDVKQCRRWIEPDDLADALQYLLDRDAIRPQVALATPRKGGRPATRAYDVNPSLLITQNTRNPQNPG